MGNKIERFTEEARYSLYLAERTAELFQHSVIDTQHLLVGLIDEKQGLAGYFLRELGLFVTHISGLAYNITLPAGKSPDQQLQLSEGIKQLLELAVNEARRLQHRYIGTVYLLVALTQQTESNACEILKQLGVSPQWILQQAKSMLEAFTPAERENVSEAKDILLKITPEERVKVKIEIYEQQYRGNEFDILTRAGWESERLNQEFIGTAHMLLALMRMEDSPAGKMLHEIGITTSQIDEQIVRLKPDVPTHETQGINVLVEAAYALNLAAIHAEDRGARTRRTDELSPEDVLFGIVRGNGWAVEILRAIGAEHEELRDKIEKTLQQVLVQSADVDVPTYLKDDESWRRGETKSDG